MMQGIGRKLRLMSGIFFRNSVWNSSRSVRLLMKKASDPNIDLMRRSLSEQLPELHARYGVKSLGIFGSFVRGQQKKRSDIDLLVEFNDEVPVTLVSFVALERELGTLLGHRVDLVERDTLKPVIGKRILEEVILV
jgi:predicted nucleotidyltransferase